MTISYGLLSTYPPTQCGLATFTASLLRALTSPAGGDRAGVVRVVEAPCACRKLIRAGESQYA
ncbi:hypothetical protein ACFPIJ_50585 [Dactylosporangium cerinum]|uniref:Uncharacterized protein n=1 Tax=Dactylosporangium cerinum TaxID=1434730 RepID=A0ABV9WBD2_9ACTN